MLFDEYKGEEEERQLKSQDFCSDVEALVSSSGRNLETKSVTDVSGVDETSQR